MATRQATAREADVTPEKALEKATTVYRRLLAQGRSEPDARRDAERWVKGNFGLAVMLPTPEPERGVEFFDDGGWGAYGNVTVTSRHYMTDLWRTMNEDAERRREDRRASINPDISRLKTEREDFARRANEAWESGDMDTLDDLQKTINYLTRRIEWHREQLRNA